jgi:hypothetical protein
MPTSLVDGFDELLHRAQAGGTAARDEVVGVIYRPVVDFRFFLGMTEADVAEALGISQKTVERDWRFARGWLFERLKPCVEFARDLRRGGPRLLADLPEPLALSCRALQAAPGVSGIRAMCFPVLTQEEPDPKD